MFEEANLHFLTATNDPWPLICSCCFEVGLGPCGQLRSRSLQYRNRQLLHLAEFHPPFQALSIPPPENDLLLPRCSVGFCSLIRKGAEGRRFRSMEFGCSRDSLSPETGFDELYIPWVRSSRRFFRRLPAAPGCSSLPRSGRYSQACDAVTRWLKGVSEYCSCRCVPVGGESSSRERYAGVRLYEVFGTHLMKHYGGATGCVLKFSVVSRIRR